MTTEKRYIVEDEFEDGEHCRLKLFINKDKYETEYPQGTIKGGDDK